jgi:hypothetical protein
VIDRSVYREANRVKIGDTLLLEDHDRLFVDEISIDDSITFTDWSTLRSTTVAPYSILSVLPRNKGRD